MTCGWQPFARIAAYQVPRVATFPPFPSILHLHLLLLPYLPLSITSSSVAHSKRHYGNRVFRQATPSFWVCMTSLYWADMRTCWTWPWRGVSSCSSLPSPRPFIAYYVISPLLRGRKAGRESWELPTKHACVRLLNTWLAATNGRTAKRAVAVVSCM